FGPHPCAGHPHGRRKETMPRIVEPRPPEARTAGWTAGVRKPFLGQGLAIAAVIAAVALRWLLDPVLGDALPLVTLFGAVAGVAWFGGYRPAITAALLGYVACWYLFMPTRGEIFPYRIGDLVGLSAYGLTCALIIGFGEVMRRTQQRAREG